MIYQSRYFHTNRQGYLLLQKLFLYSLTLLLVTLFSRQVFAWNNLTDSIDINCTQNINLLDCNYRFLNEEQALAITAKDKQEPLAVIDDTLYSDKSHVTAVLFLVDTSDPARQKVIEKNKQHIKRLIASGKENYKYGLASFDKKLNILSPIGTSSFLITKSLNALKAEGRTTELYRSLLTAIAKLNSFEADRKLIYLLSDGQAEDKAYFHTDIITATRKSNIVVNSIGYPRSVSLSVALQTLRRISDETGGSFYETDMGHELPESYIKNAFNNIDSGGSFSVDLKKSRSNKITLVFQTDSGNKTISVPIKANVSKSDTNKTKELINTETIKPIAPPVQQQTTAPIQVITKQVETQPVNLWLWYGLPAAFIIIIIFILIILFLLWHRPAINKNDSKNDYKPYAYLLTNDGTDTRYPITRTIWRIGRSKDNELSLDDTSISRRHAEIHRNTNGTFEIIDMNSMNGIYINDEKIGKATLQEGDVIEIGDIFLHFTQFPSGHANEESTVMQKTKVPITH